MLLRKVYCFLAAMILPGVAVAAQDNADLGSWSSLQAIKSFERTFVTARLEHRSFERMSSTECSFAALGGGYRVAPWLVADVSYEFWKVNAAGNLLTHKAVTSLTASLKREKLAFSLREKYELAFPDGGSAYGTLRSRLRAQYNCGALTPYLMYEYFNGFSGTTWVRSLHYAGVELRFASRHCLDLFYMYHIFPSGSSSAACNILGLGYTVSL